MRYFCNICKRIITKKVYAYSIDCFGKALCLEHQKEGNAQKYSCSICRVSISGNVYDFSTNRIGVPLCMYHQKTVSPQAIKLSSALNDLAIKHTLEYNDGFKHVDIAIKWAKLYLELDGNQHGFSPKQMCADDERDKHSQQEGFFTKRIPNAWVDENVEKVAVSIAILANKRYREILENQNKYTLTGMIESGITKLSDGLDDYE